MIRLAECEVAQSLLEDYLVKGLNDRCWKIVPKRDSPRKVVVFEAVAGGVDLPVLV